MAGKKITGFFHRIAARLSSSDDLGSEGDAAAAASGGGGASAAAEVGGEPVPPDDVFDGGEEGQLSGPLTASSDISLFAKKQLTVDLLSAGEKKAILDLKPPKDTFQFPKSGKDQHKRSFQMSWLKEFLWLRYSEMEDGAYCGPCLAFGVGKKAGVGKGGTALVSQLVKEPYRGWKEAKAVFKRHSNHGYHKASIVDAASFSRQYGRDCDIASVLDKKRQKELEARREQLCKLVKLILFLGTQEMGFRGHREHLGLDGGEQQQKGESGEPEIEGAVAVASQHKVKANANQGNMIALINLIRDIDPVFKQQMDEAGGRAKFTSHGVHDEIIKIIGDFIQEQIVEKINRSAGGIFA